MSEEKELTDLEKRIFGSLSAKPEDIQPLSDCEKETLKAFINFSKNPKDLKDPKDLRDEEWTDIDIEKTVLNEFNNLKTKCGMTISKDIEKIKGCNDPNGIICLTENRMERVQNGFNKASTWELKEAYRWGFDRYCELWKDYSTDYIEGRIPAPDILQESDLFQKKSGNTITVKNQVEKESYWPAIDKKLTELNISNHVNGRWKPSPGCGEMAYFIYYLKDQLKNEFGIEYTNSDFQDRYSLKDFKKNKSDYGTNFKKNGEEPSQPAFKEWWNTILDDINKTINKK